MTWDDLDNDANRAKIKAKIYDNFYLYQQCTKNKKPLKIKDAGRHKRSTFQLKAQVSQIESKVNLAKQRKQIFIKVRKKKKNE